ncbi:MAG: cytochrome c4 [Proteobacteria bacterium]|nr:cytochrome c4 [Pseudomonadota bacterium]
MKTNYIGVILLGVSSLMSFALFAGDPETGKTRSAVCAGCHGLDGNSAAGTWPILAGQHANYLIKQMQDYKSGKRADPIMQGMASMLSETDMQDIAAYYSGQKAKPVTFDDSLVAQGENIYRGGITETSVAACMGCHSPSGAGLAPAGFPSLKGQHTEYLESQLRKFRSGLRANDVGEVMRSVAARMTEQEIKAVAAYIAGIQ